MTAISTARRLSPANERKYKALRRRYVSDFTFRAVVDMYRNLHAEPAVAAHWMAQHDVDTYAVQSRGVQTFAPVAAGYSREELAFLLERGVKPL